MRHGPAKQALVICAVQIDIALERVAAWPAIDPILESFESEDAGQDQVALGQLPAPCLTRRLARGEDGTGNRILTDPGTDAVPSGRGPKGALLAANPGTRRGDGPYLLGLPIPDQDGKLAFDIDHKQPRRQVSRSACAHEALAREVKRTGSEQRTARNHARTLP